MMRESSVDAEAHRLVRAGRFEEALPLAERTVAGARACCPGHALLASILLKLGRVHDAEETIARAASLETGVAGAYDGLAYVSVELGRHELANALYRRATELAPQTPRYWYNFACSERGFGRLAQAEEACDRAIALDASQYPTYLLRSELRVQADDANHIEELKSRLAGPRIDVHGKIFLGYALAKELDDVRRFDEAFHCFAAAAAARRGQTKYDVARDEQVLGRIEETYPRKALGEAMQAVGNSPAIFIVGLPRSGTTLVERILTGLPGVRSNGETENFSQALAAAAPKSGRDIFERAAAADPEAVAANYRRLARLEGADRVIEKLPTNYLYLGAIRRALPAAKILWVKRAPLDSCFAMYRTLFGEAYPFSYDFEDLARYYAAYERLMGHWQRVMGGSIHEIMYEDLVRSPARVGAAAAEHCGLNWKPEATDIQSNRSVSLTASAAQVRRPIYGSSSGRWRQYRTHLAPLLASLRLHGVSLPADA
jgi:Sulfotransferase family/Tetratricopeptide repeat